MKRLVLAALKLYRATAAYRTPCCRFYPSCSKYMIGCIEVHGLAKGLLLGTLRLLRCHPFHPGGIDEVPVSRLEVSAPRTLPGLR
jgi:putative membrane protein insertion efficiency factor